MDSLLPTPKKKKKTTFSTDTISQALATSSSDSSNSYYSPPKSPEIAPAAAQALQFGASPDILSKAQKYLGSKDFTGLCERFGELVTQGKTGMFASAIDAFNKQRDKVRTDFQNMPTGSQIFFSANKGNDEDGHTGVSSGDGKFISATNSGVKDLDINKWAKSTGQVPLGYIPPATTGGSS